MKTDPLFATKIDPPLKQKIQFSHSKMRGVASKGMITIEKWTTIRALKQEGHSIRSITKLLSVSRNTVRKALKAEKFPTYQRKEKEDKLIAPFEEIVREYVGKG
ncbi:helix-turn-helix domain-containing protein [Bacillus cytotoxicus]|nr:MULTISPECIES: helix-turn-helix domain-containing protein [Bacillus cereus group]MDH2865687.1 helix-turn-helix domain-containing protein [Bacillus cytotoxicus]MDH2885703.1 helix-turn-helix domain-containing protein [Bacillus cytotoxicus]MDH2889643.1 helix-turn-helix domain-containing protein [Bacillus cytotoxicus]NZD34968.1 helix-turn-helix domain-containing protein [Bacillus cytotoxicus]QTR69739.1 helix-turn-helix domain-containing protein [Bacillus cytotoxicus]